MKKKLLIAPAIAGVLAFVFTVSVFDKPEETKTSVIETSNIELPKVEPKPVETVGVEKVEVSESQPAQEIVSEPAKTELTPEELYAEITNYINGLENKRTRGVLLSTYFSHSHAFTTDNYKAMSEEIIEYIESDSGSTSADHEIAIILNKFN